MFKTTFEIWFRTPTHQGDAWSLHSDGYSTYEAAEGTIKSQKQRFVNGEEVAIVKVSRSPVYAFAVAITLAGREL